MQVSMVFMILTGPPIRIAEIPVLQRVPAERIMNLNPRLPGVSCILTGG